MLRYGSYDYMNKQEERRHDHESPVLFGLMRLNYDVKSYASYLFALLMLAHTSVLSPPIYQ